MLTGIVLSPTVTEPLTPAAVAANSRRGPRRARAAHAASSTFTSLLDTDVDQPKGVRKGDIREPKCHRLKKENLLELKRNKQCLMESSYDFFNLHRMTKGLLKIIKPRPISKGIKFVTKPDFAISMIYTKRYYSTITEVKRALKMFKIHSVSVSL